MSQSTRSSMLLNFLLLTILALSSLGSTRPISSSGSGLSRSDLHSRSASPRVIPSAGEYRDKLLKNIFNALGLASLNDLDAWKSKLEDSKLQEAEAIDDSNSPNSTVTAEHNAVVDGAEPQPDDQNSDDQQTDDTADADPVGIVDDVLSVLVDKFHEAFLTQDEVTL